MCVCILENFYTKRTEHTQSTEYEYTRRYLCSSRSCWEVQGDNRIGLEVLGLEEVSELLERRLLVIVVLVNGDEAVADGALELDAVLRALGLLDDDPEELLDGRRGRRRGPRRRRRPGIARRPSCPSSSAGGPPARRCWPCQGRRRWRCT